MDNDKPLTEPENQGLKEEHLLLVWERAIETQMHFAELSIKTRQIGMTVVGATLGLAIVLELKLRFCLRRPWVELPDHEHTLLEQAALVCLRN